MHSLERYADPGGLSSSESIRVAHLLELPEPNEFDELGLARRVSDGLPTDSANPLIDLFGRKEIIGPLIPEATFRRLRKNGKPLPPQYSERLYSLSKIVDVVSRVYHGDETRVREFMTRRHSLLDGETPLKLARSGSAGADVVLNLVLGAEAGFPV